MFASLSKSLLKTTAPVFASFCKNIKFFKKWLNIFKQTFQGTAAACLKLWNILFFYEITAHLLSRSFFPESHEIVRNTPFS